MKPLLSAIAAALILFSAQGSDKSDALGVPYYNQHAM
ncbi:multiple antibiotic resistance regulatory protein MarB [Escherichia coli]|nr:multiple antibiotic resistance regulatory protein MarB [Escherichia coli]EED1456827.1 multiple antibiotic resistance regulatory protein MarB [Escherichia coli]EFA6175183.1 multiple antibiotic resistance regulatory protein MarB [Escherichia coli]EFA6317609.1 multiple antibiotic resistance regulatory protein MarB [Escherichia coli]NYR55859.1 multiple antibiotic resistance regulatory protein MarB [Escherichia coli]HBD0613676.1 multiple antibiotic resistance regulatory protein MarB [Escherichia